MPLWWSNLYSGKVKGYDGVVYSGLSTLCSFKSLHCQDELLLVSCANLHQSLTSAQKICLDLRHPHIVICWSHRFHEIGWFLSEISQFEMLVWLVLNELCTVVEVWEYGSNAASLFILWDSDFSLWGRQVMHFMGLLQSLYVSVLVIIRSNQRLRNRSLSDSMNEHCSLFIGCLHYAFKIQCSLKLWKYSNDVSSHIVLKFP